MTKDELLQLQLSETEKQLRAVFANFPAENWHDHLTPHSMSADETARHLCDCYEALKVNSQGGKFEWGSFSIGEKSQAELVDFLFEHRTAAINIAKDSRHEKADTLIAEYVVLHDCYHVGQLATMRLNFGEFDPYSIY
jgi:uncharacterized damage-inducible protein DinB